MLVCQLPAAYRKLLRPSSPVIAKASTTCTYSLDSIISTVFDLNIYLFAQVCNLPRKFFIQTYYSRRYIYNILFAGKFNFSLYIILTC